MGVGVGRGSWAGIRVWVWLWMGAKATVRPSLGDPPRSAAPVPLFSLLANSVNCNDQPPPTLKGPRTAPPVKATRPQFAND